MLIVVMGVSGSGKSTLGQALAQSLGCDFVEGDDYHPSSNIEKMRAGLPLTEEDRSPWLERLHNVMASIAKQGGSAVLACSALKKNHRDVLAQGLAAIRFAFLYGDPKLIRERLRAREHDFMPPELLDSQIAALEPPDDAVLVDIGISTDEQVKRVRRGIGISERS